jgi:hypothetical protein
MRAGGGDAAFRQQNGAERALHQELVAQFKICNEPKNSPGCEAIGHGLNDYDSGSRHWASAE